MGRFNWVPGVQSQINPYRILDGEEQGTGLIAFLDDGSTVFSKRPKFDRQ